MIPQNKGCYLWLVALFVALVLLAAIPARADLRTLPAVVDLSAYLPPVTDAGLYAPVCTPVAVGYYYRSLQARMRGASVTYSSTYSAMPVVDAILLLWERGSIEGYTRLPLDVDALRAHLAGGDAFVAVFPMYGDWQFLFWEHTATITGPRAGQQLQGWHTVCIVGYDDGRTAFRVVNCWGTTWGIGGLGWLSYEYVRRYAYEAWCMTPMQAQMVR